MAVNDRVKRGSISGFASVLFFGLQGPVWRGDAGAKGQVESGINVNAYEEWLFYLLFSLKAGLTYDVLGFIFGCDGSTAKRNQRRGLQILQKALVLAGVMPARHFEKVVDFEKWLAEDPVLVLDGTEQRSQRPANMDVQKDFYSGKKKPVP